MVFFPFCYQEIKLKIVSLSRNKTKMGREKKFSGQTAFLVFYILFPLNCHLTWFSLHFKKTPGVAFEDKHIT